MPSHPAAPPKARGGAGHSLQSLLAPTSSSFLEDTPSFETVARAPDEEIDGDGMRELITKRRDGAIAMPFVVALKQARAQQDGEGTLFMKS